jgi:Ca2+-transporting ATPase
MSRQDSPDPPIASEPTGRELCELPDDSARAGGVATPWARPWEELTQELQVEPPSGLSGAEVGRRRGQYGANCLPGMPPQSLWILFVNQFRSLIVGLLVAAAAVAFVSGNMIEGHAVLAVIVINAAIGFFTEMRAVRSMEALQRLGAEQALVRRDGQLRHVTSQELVPGDILVLEAGQVVTADARLIEVSQLQADESVLTGESAPVAKGLAPVAEDAIIAERFSMVFRGTALTRGSGEAVVVATGPATEVGQVTQLVAEAEEVGTPLEHRLNQLGQRLVWVTLLIAAAIIGLGLLQEREVLLMIRTGIALAVATIPEGLPIVATAALARGMLRMARHNALVRRLSAVETLGATSLICTDKTGTLTENRMTVRWVALADGDIEISGGAFEIEGEFRREGQVLDPSEHPLLLEALRIGVLCNTAGLDPHSPQAAAEAVGDPMEVALQVAALKAGIKRQEVLAEHPELREEAFDSELQMMATVHEAGAGALVAVKGAPETVLRHCTAVLTAAGEQPLDEAARQQWSERNERLASEGLRLLALAEKTVTDAQAPPYADLTLVGLVGVLDPPRQEVRAALDLARAAGIRVVMLTGDQAPTARQVAAAVGLPVDGEALSGRDVKPPGELTAEDRTRLLATSIFARVSPRQKLDLVELYQQAGHIVAMTGDGVNDAPALGRADIGVAMGKRGTQVARDAADMVLLDDSFSSIVYAVEQGRVIYRNIRRFVVYLLSCNISEVLAVAIAALLNAPLPILPLQILFLNLVTDVFPALALGAGEGEPGLMQRPPRPAGEPILAARHWQRIVAYGGVITVTVLGALWLAMAWLKLPSPQAVTVSFLTLALAQLWHVLNMRDPASSMWNNDTMRNRYIWAAIAGCLLLTVAAVMIPPVAQVLHLESPGWRGWMVAVVLSLMPLLAGQALKPWERRQDERARGEQGHGEK